ncbi:hypothetical protein ABZP12_04552 (plasmid) [Xanthomonas euvesicatoria]
MKRTLLFSVLVFSGASSMFVAQANRWNIRRLRQRG